MSTAAVSARAGARPARLSCRGSGALALGVVTVWLSVIVVLPLAAVVVRSTDGGLDAFWASASSRQAVSALRFTLVVSLVVAMSMSILIVSSGSTYSTAWPFFWAVVASYS